MPLSPVLRMRPASFRLFLPGAFRLRLTPVLTFVPDRGIKEEFEITEKLKGLLK